MANGWPVSTASIGNRSAHWRTALQQKSLQSSKRHLDDYKAYRTVMEVKRALGKRFKKAENLIENVVYLTSERPTQGHVLLSFINEPFLFTPDQAGMYGQHTHYWAVLEIAKTFLDLGYNVDVIRWNNDKFIPQKDYSFFIDLRLNLERIGHLLSRDCIKIMYIETAHWLFHMTAQHNRLFAIQQRKGATLSPYKTVSPNWGIEHADCATFLGNGFTMSTYSYANKPLYRVPVISPVVCPWPEGKNFDACRKHFLWFGSGGLVHKGLDLVLDAFAEMPEYHLTVCGPIKQEKDFETAYYRELYQTPNIHTLGWVKASSPEFIEIANNCVGLIYPSCSEGGGGSVATCMHAGLIPLVSYESSVDVADDFGVILKSCSIEAIKDTVRKISNLPGRELKQMAWNAWEFARAHHTKEKFAEEFRKVLAKIVMAQRQEGR
jgi:glycosyltransferase involved in cell wall biosynthesis